MRKLPGKGSKVGSVREERGGKGKGNEGREKDEQEGRRIIFNFINPI